MTGVQACALPIYAPHKLQVGRSALDIRLCASFTVRGETIPPRDPYAGPLDAVDHDEYDGIVLCDAAPDAGDAVRAAEPGGWIAFRDVGFAGGAAACRLQAGGPEGGVLTLRLDDPLFGPVAGTVTVPATGRHEFATVGCPLLGATGVRDLYLVFEDAGLTVRTLAFTAAAPPGDPR